MGVIIGAAVILTGCALAIRRERKKRKDTPPAAVASGREIRCPTCGSPAVWENGHWECGHCGDSGSG